MERRGEENWHAAEPRPQYNNGTLCRGDDGESGNLELIVLTSQRKREIITFAVRFAPSAVCRVSTKAKINPTVDGVLMAREGGRGTLHSCQSVTQIGGAVFEMAFGDTTSDGDRDPPSPHRPLYRSRMLHAEQQRGSQPEGGGAREGEGVRDIGLTDRERVNKPEQINIISRRSLDRRIRSYGRGRRDKLPSIHVRRQLVGAVSLAAHMAAAALRRRPLLCK